MPYSLVITTTASQDSARALARSIIEAKLAACVHVEPVSSFYVWNEKMHEDAEWRLSIKTRHELYAALADHIRKNHDYETPEILEIAIIDGDPAYLRWIDESIAR